MHYEVELGLIMGKTVRDLDPEDTKGAMDAIEGKFLLVDSTYLFSIPSNTRN
jgi:acylpyruvate hydrolase